MSAHLTLDDTIAAIATAEGPAALAVVRLSGPRAVEVADRVLRGNRPLAESASHTLRHGWVVWPDSSNGSSERLDEVVAAVFRAPASYTREDVVELSCHGGSWPARRVLDAVLAAGARLARPGEFSLRAFLNGRLDLAQAEAVADLIAAETRAAHTIALAQLAGALSRRVRSVADRLTDVLADIEARVDFAEDVGGVEVPEAALESLATVTAELGALLDGGAFARAVRDGARVPIVGRPNVGKSSLFNALVGEERAIVAASPGTTRDRVSESVEIDGIRIALSDTAGIRDGEESVERIGIDRSRAALDESPVAIWVVDGSAPLDADDRRIARLLETKRTVVALNKSDLPGRIGEHDVAGVLAGVLGEATGHRDSESSVERSFVRVSALRGEGVGAVRTAVLGALGVSSGATAPPVTTGNPRHLDALARSRAAFEAALQSGRSGEPGEIVAADLRAGLAALGEVTGENVGADLLDRIFSRFCIGK